jgi:EAL domain-containing protein (putative c-di-GMP-specific phosphodiesterase class I)
VLGAEALVRWHHPTKGLLLPGSFIECAAESDLMSRLGWWIINDSCRIASAVVAQGSPDFQIAVNITGQQFAEPGFAERCLDVVRLHGLEPRNVCLEITETVFIEEGPLISHALEALTEAGIDVALDDFGTGFSSLNHVRDMPVKTLKIHHSYTSRITSCAATRAIVEATRDLANKLGLRIIVEGVETAEQKEVLLSMDLGVAQGYLMARPCDEETFSADYVPLLSWPTHEPDLEQRHDASSEAGLRSSR